MNHADFCTWTDEGNGVYSFGVCGVNLRTENTAWDVTLPSGQHERGTAESTEAAKQNAFDVFVAFAIRQLVDHKVALPTHAAV